MLYTILIIHLICTFTSIFIGYYLFLFSKKSLQSQKIKSTILCAALVVSGITGILLNPYSFSPFHALSVVTISTIPLALHRFLKSDFLKFNLGVFYNFIGLNVAMIGALEPSRYLGRRIRLSETNWQIIMILSIVLAILAVYQANSSKKFFKV